MKGKDKLNADMTNACAEQPHVEIINHLNIFDVSPLHHFFGAHPCVKYHCTIFFKVLLHHFFGGNKGGGSLVVGKESCKEATLPL